jgi:hypothetical protein
MTGGIIGLICHAYLKLESYELDMQPLPPKMLELLWRCAGQLFRH